MSDARDIVHPRWKRRATEIAEAIGGNSGGLSSVSLDQNTITSLSQAIADAIDLKVLDINIRKYDDDFVSSAGIPIRSGISPASAGYLPLRVVTDVGDKLDINVKEYNDVSVDTRGLPVQAGRTSNNTLQPLVVNCLTTNNFPSGGSGGTTFPSVMDVNIVKFGGGNNISASASLPITGSVSCTQNTGSARPWIVSTGVQGSNTLGQWGTTTVDTTVNNTVSVTETNPVSGGGTSLTQQHVETAMDNALANATGISVTESVPVNTVSVNNHPTPVTTVSVDNHPTSTIVTGTVSVNNHPISTTVTGTVSVTETNPVSGGTGGLNITDTTTAFKNALYGVGVTANTTVHEQVETAMDSALANATGISVTESAPVTAVTATIPNTVSTKLVGDETHGIIMSKTWANAQAGIGGSGTVMGIGGTYSCEGFGLGTTSSNTYQQNVTRNYTTGWTIRQNGVDILNQDISFGLEGTSPTPTTSNPSLTRSQQHAAYAQAYPLHIGIDNQGTVDLYHGRKVTLSAVANVWILEPIADLTPELEPLGTIQWETSGSGSSQFRFTIMDDQGTAHVSQAVYTGYIMDSLNSGANLKWPTYWSNSFAGVRVVRAPIHGANRWQMIGYRDQ